jgi:hypothetical protein
MKHETKHTPGPWHVESRKSFGNFYEIRSGGKGIACIADENGREEANAALIAAAPDMLEALEKISALHPVKCILVEVKQARDAIAKAKGNQ